MRCFINFRSAPERALVLAFLAAALTFARADYPIFQDLNALTNALSEASGTNQHAGSLQPGLSREIVSPWLAEFLKLAHAGLDEEVLMAFIANTEGTFNLGADQIVVLRDLGVSDWLINALIDHDRELISGARELKAAVVPGPPMNPLLALSGAPVAAARSSAEVDDSIIVRDDRQAAGSGIVHVVSAEIPIDNEVASTPRCAAEFKPYRVRKPHSVRLTDPIVVFRSAPRIPNLLVIHPLR